MVQLVENPKQNMKITLNFMVKYHRS